MNELQNTISNDTERLVNREDAARIINALYAIADKDGKRFVKPTLSQKTIPYDGEQHSVIEIFDNYDSDSMLLTGDVIATEQGVYTVFVQLKRYQDVWLDNSSDVLSFSWMIGSNGELSWSNASDDNIVSLINASDAGRIDLVEDCGWEVGDIREVQLSAMEATGVSESHVAQTVQLALVAKDTGVQDVSNPCYNYQYVTPIEGGRTYPKFIVQQVEGLKESGYMNSSSSNAGSWNGCLRRTWCNTVYKDAMPSTLINAFKQAKVKTIATYNGDSIQESDDYFFLPAEVEIFSSLSYSNAAESTTLAQWPYYVDSTKIIKKSGSAGSAVYWWERSPDASYYTRFCAVGSNAAKNAGNASNKYLLAPAGCI